MRFRNVLAVYHLSKGIILFSKIDRVSSFLALHIAGIPEKPGGIYGHG
jgi:hypothetical protein